MGAVAARLSDASRSVLQIPRVAVFLERLVEGEALWEAARGAGLRVKRARALLQIPAVRREYFRGIEAVQDAERARNVALRVAVRDRGFTETATAAHVRQALIAADRLDGIDGRAPGSVVNVGVQVGSVVGYVMDLREPDDEDGALPALSSGGRATTVPSTAHDLEAE